MTNLYLHFIFLFGITGFSSLLDELTHFSGGRKLTLDPAVLESYSHELMQMTKDRKQNFLSDLK